MDSLRLYGKNSLQPGQNCYANLFEGFFTLHGTKISFPFAPWKENSFTFSAQKRI